MGAGKPMYGRGIRWASPTEKRLVKTWVRKHLRREASSEVRLLVEELALPDQPDLFEQWAEEDHLTLTTPFFFAGCDCDSCELEKEWVRLQENSLWEATVGEVI